MSLSDKTNIAAKRQTRDKDELLLQENDKRFVMFPIKYYDIWRAYKDSLSNVWICEQLESNFNWVHLLSNTDKEIVKKITSYWAGYHEQSFIHHLSSEVQIPEGRSFFGFQINVQMTHIEVFSILYNKLECKPSQIIEKKKIVLKNWFKNQSFAGRIVAYSVMESLFVTSIDLLKEFTGNNAELMELNKICNLVLKDKESYTKFGQLLYNYCVNKLPKEEFQSMIKDAVKLEKDFLDEIFINTIVKFDSVFREQLVEYKADLLCEMFAYGKIFNRQNPFE